MPRVRVPQSDGAIAIASNGEPATEFPVTKGIVDVPQARLAEFLGLIPGASVVAETPTAGGK